MTLSLWQSAGEPRGDGDAAGRCRVCGQDGTGLPFAAWVKATFTDHDKMVAGTIICHACQFAFAEASELLAERVGKDKPQRMRNYSHIVCGGAWYPLSKGAKAEMRRLIMEERPDLIVLADSGQKHIVFRATPNDPRGDLLRIQFEEQSIMVGRNLLRQLVATMTTMLTGGFSKENIERGEYPGHRVLRYGLPAFRRDEELLRPHRGGGVFAVALYLAQKEEQDGGQRATGTDNSDGGMAGNQPGVQEPLSDEHLAAVRGPGAERGVHDEPEPVRQLALL